MSAMRERSACGKREACAHDRPARVECLTKQRRKMMRQVRMNAPTRGRVQEARCALAARYTILSTP